MRKIGFIGQPVCTATAETPATGQRAGVELISAGAVNSALFRAMAKTLDGDMIGATIVHR